MRKMNNRARFASRNFQADDEVTIGDLEQQLDEVLSTGEEIDESSIDDEIADAEKAINNAENGGAPAAPSAPAEPSIDDEIASVEKAIGDFEAKAASKKAKSEVAGILKEADDVLKACNKISAGAKLPDNEDIVNENASVKAEIEEVEKQIACKEASSKKAGIEDQIGDQAHGGDASVSELPKTKIDCDTDKEVFGQNTDCKYVASVTAKLDRVAAALEKRGLKKMAFRIDQLSDRLEASVKKH